MLSQGRNTIETFGNKLSIPVKPDTTIFEGALVAIEDGYAIPAKKATGLIVAGRAEQYINSTSSEAYIEVKRGAFKYDNDTINLVEPEHILKDCYMLDDETVTANAEGTSKAGKVLGFSDNQVIIEIL